MQNQSKREITFDTELKTALLEIIGFNALVIYKGVVA